jgi:hypothetical protein
VLYVGVNNDGTIQRHKEPVDFEKLQKSVSNRIDEAWPPIYRLPKTLRKGDDEFLAVLVPGSEFRPHFSGPSFVRVGLETRKASEKQFDELIAQRSSKFRALRKLIGKVVFWHSSESPPFGGYGHGTVIDCNQFFATIDVGTYKRCFPIAWIVISFDPNENEYQLIVQS